MREEPRPAAGGEVEDPLAVRVLVVSEVSTVGREDDPRTGERRVGGLGPCHQAAVPVEVEGLHGVVVVDGVNGGAIGGVADLARRLGCHVLDVSPGGQVPDRDRAFAAGQHPVARPVELDGGDDSGRVPQAGHRTTVGRVEHVAAVR